MRWSVGQRLEFIEFRLFWEGSINRSDLVNYFKMSVPQASKDLSRYQEQAPGNMRYDPSEKKYFAEPEFMLRFLDPDPYVYLSQLRAVTEGTMPMAEAWIADWPSVDVAVTPKRGIDIEVLRAILDATRNEQSVEVLYQSMNRKRPDPVWRRITPHAFGYDGFRWHARAFCHLEDKFKDFLLPRTLNVRDAGMPGASGADDQHWNSYIDVELAPHPDLTDSQKKVVALDYGFTDGKGVITVRCAMLFYVLKRLGLLGDAENEDPRRQHIVALNKDEVFTALRNADFSAHDLPTFTTTPMAGDE
jgi:hypothetical protein